MKQTMAFISFLFLVFCLPFYQVDGDEVFKEESSLKRMHDIANDQLKAKKLFSKINRISSQIKKSKIHAEANPSKNRTSFYPFDETRTCREIPNFYISASDIDTPNQKYIVAQAPIEETVQDFWKMILYKHVQIIITACMPIESQRDRCTPYWKKPYLPDEVIGWQIFLVKEEIFKKGPNSERIVKRTFTAIRSKTRIQRTVIQFHFENWKDYSVPDLDLFNEFLQHADEYSNQESPILVHCSAGVGRSGTFVAAHSLRQDILAGKTVINIPQRIFDIRLQRAELVTSLKQFQFIYKALLPLLS